MEWLTNPQIWAALVTLTVLEIVLGIDNIIFISILVDKLPSEQQPSARTLGLALAMLIRIALLFSLTWVMQLTTPLFQIFYQEISGRDLILIGGGLFLLGKSTLEIHDKLEGEEGHASTRVKGSFLSIIIQIILLDIVFSLDSVITAIGMASHLAIMVTAVVIAVIFMMFFAAAIGTFVNRHPTVKILALSFLLLIGMALVGEGFDMHLPKGYIYFAMAFSVLVEFLNMKVRKSATPIQLRQAYTESIQNKSIR
ncbi:MAG: TerC family protein [Thioploca sp.]|nr:TerC family protein [Thioploca sp.]